MQRKAEAIVLKRRDYKENARIVTVFTAKFGWFDLIVEGIKKPASQWVGALEPFSWIELDFAEAKTWQRFTAASIKTAFVPPGSAVELMAAAYALAEPVTQLIPERESQPEVYGALLEALGELPHMEPELVLAWFRLRLLGLLGFPPSLSRCAVGDETIPPEQIAGLSVGRGAVVCADHLPHAPLSAKLLPRAVKLLFLISRAPISRLRGVAVHEEERQQLSDVIHQLLCYHTERRMGRAAEYFEQGKASSPLF